MRRAEREITDYADILSLIERCEVCRVALFDDEFPYIIPLSFGYRYLSQDDTLELYFHSAQTGKKRELLERNNQVAFEMDILREVLLNNTACSSSMAYESICGTGILSIVAADEKLAALTAIMSHYQPVGKHCFGEASINNTLVLKLTVRSITAKHAC